MSAEVWGVVRAFAAGLDREDYDSVERLLSPNCRYRVDGKVITGPKSIVASYRGNGEAAKFFDSITYRSQVTGVDERTALVTFSDHLVHGDLTQTYSCEQVVIVNGAGLVVDIEHRELPGRREALVAFKKQVGFEG